MKKFLPTKDYHVLEISGLSVKDIKNTVKKCKIDRKTFKKTTALNFVAKHFGIEEGFSAYAKWHENDLLPFMNNNGLAKYRDLTHNPINDGAKFFTHQEIADRLYFSGKPTPKRIFTGHNFISRFVLEEIAADFLFDAKMEKEYRKIPEFSKYSTEELRKDFIHASLFGLVNPDVSKIHNHILFIYKNLIYDTFIDNKEPNKDVFPEYPYEDNMFLLPELKEENLQNYTKTFGKRLQEHLLKFEDGWVEVIPFNDLYFLKASNGDYDLVFRNLKDKAFETGDSFFTPYLKHTDVPSSFNESYDFDRWLYFGHKSKSDNLKKIKVSELWEERDRELANKEYPNAVNALKEYYTHKGKYQYLSNGNKEKPDFFQTVIISEHESLHISDVITIKQLDESMDENANYRDNRHSDLDKLQPLNSEKDKSLPATVTWYDAVAYCKWIENKYDIPARLLTLDEYQSLHPYPNGCFENEDYRNIYNRYEKDYQGGVRINSDGIFLNDVRFTEVPQLNSPEYRSDFDDLTFSFVKRPTYIQSKDNLSFCISPSFGEWLFDHYKEGAAAILPYFMQSLYGDSNFYFDPKLSGKHKYRKIGFRICYTTKKDA